MTGQKRLIVGPAVTDRGTLASLVLRLAHYVAHVDVERIDIAVTSELSDSIPDSTFQWLELADGLDPEALRRVPAIVPKIKLRVFPGSPIEPVADHLLFWDVTGREHEPWLSLAKRYRQNRTKFDVDWANTRTDGIWLAELALVLSKSSRAYDPRESERFRQRTEHLVGSKQAYLVATGPSATEALDVDMSDGVRIVCNTAILDDALIDHVAPDIVTFADPIFHFGPSTYAHQFQRALGRAAVRHDFTIVTVERYAPLLRDRLPHLEERIVGVRLGSVAWPQNYDLLRDLAVRPYPNIMTMLMLPLATTFSRSINLFGFDGREPKETYFWRHGTTVQFDRELAEIRLAHPGFFEVSYEDYYGQHVYSVEQMFTDIELRGGAVHPRSHSFMLPLRRRRATADADPTSRARPATGLPIVSVTPDWTGSFGHFGPWERSVGTAARAAGYDYRSLASRAVETDDPFVLPTFTVGTLNRDSANPTRFEAELRAGIAAAACGDAIVCFYAADVWQLASVLQLAAERPGTTFVVNLMRSHPAVTDLKDGHPTVPARLLRECLDIAANSNVHVCFDSNAIVTDLEEATGRRVPTWPMIMLGDPDLLLQHASAGFVGDGPTRLVAPVHAHVVRGFPELVDAAEALRDELESRQYSLTARFVEQPGGLSGEHIALAQRFRDAGGELVTTNLSDAGYAALVGSAHVIVLPYRLDTFRTRTSGVLLDAIAAAKPVVAVRGTWAGDIVEEFGIGRTYVDRDIESLLQTIRQVVDEIGPLTEQANRQRDQLIAAFRPQQLITFLVALSSKKSPAPDSRRLAGLRTLVDVSVESHWVSTTRRQDQRISEMVEVDELNRSRDDLRDKIEELRRVIAWNQREVERLRRAEAARTEPAVTTGGRDG